MANLEDFGKETYFEDHGYTWDGRFDIYVNKDQWKIFGKDYIDDHSFDVLMVNLKEEPTPGHWKFYFNTESPLDIHTLGKHYAVSAGMKVK